MPARKPDPDPDEIAAEEAKLDVRRIRFRRELLGMFYGLSGALILSAVFPQIREQYSLGVVVLWGGAIGGLLASYERFERAGAALTRSENPLLNYLVGLGIPLIIIAIFYFSGR